MRHPTMWSFVYGGALLVCTAACTDQRAVIGPYVPPTGDELARVVVDTTWLMPGRVIEISLEWAAGVKAPIVPTDFTVDAPDRATIVRRGWNSALLRLTQPGLLRLRASAGSLVAERTLVIAALPPLYTGDAIADSVLVGGGLDAYQSVRSAFVRLRMPSTGGRLDVMALMFEAEDDPATKVCSGSPLPVTAGGTVRVGSNALVFNSANEPPDDGLAAKVRLIVRDAGGAVSRIEVSTPTVPGLPAGLVGPTPLWGCR